jgi:rubrerythrin
MSAMSKVSRQDIRKIIFDNYNNTDVRFSNDEILDHLNEKETYRGMELDVLDFEDVLLEMENSRMLRPIAQNFNTRYYRLWEPVNESTCNSCGAPTYFASSEEERRCPHCSAIL